MEWAEMENQNSRLNRKGFAVSPSTPKSRKKLAENPR